MPGIRGSGGGLLRAPRQALRWWQTVLAVRRRYAGVFGHNPHVLLPRTHSERIVHTKLLRRDPRMPPLADKIAVKAFVADRVGPQYVVPTIWSGSELPPRRLMRSWPRPFVLKASHGSGWTTFVPESGPVPWARIERRAQRWLDQTYGAHAGEWLYSRIPPGLLVEPHLGDPSDRPDDYKLWVFQGRVHYVNWVTGRGSPAYGGRMMDRSWNEVFVNRSQPLAPALPPRPESLETMIRLAERLGDGFPFVRVDLYEIDGRPFFGELTFYPMSGYLPLDPPSADLTLGRLWRRPRRRSSAASPTASSAASPAAPPEDKPSARATVGGRP